MNNAQLRPRYQFQSPHEPDVIYAQIMKALQKQSLDSKALHWRTVSGHIVINLPREEQHYWSPHLDVNLEKREEGGTTVRILAGPAPAVWTMVMFFYALCILMFLGGLILGYSQYMLDKPASWFRLIPISVVLAGLLWGIGLIGKKMGRSQTRQLIYFLEKALQQSIIRFS